MDPTSSTVAGSSASSGAAGGFGGAGGASEAGAGGANGGAGASSTSASASAQASSSSEASSSGVSSSSSGSGGGGGCAPPDLNPTIPATLSATGLYTDIASKTVAPSVRDYSVVYPLWSDGADKQRFILLPDCTTIDTSDMDHWELPPGAKLWKEFSVGGSRIETRYIHRTGPTRDDFTFVAYQWDAGETDAAAVPNGVTDANGTTHDIPAQWECLTCHDHLPERVIGFGAIQLSHGGGGWTLASLIAAGRLSAPGATSYSVPGDATARAALGYLHGNCSHCHNSTVEGEMFATPYDLRVAVAAQTVQETSTWLTAVNVPTAEFMHPGIIDRITAGDPSSSCVTYRMGQRGDADQMPPFGTKVVDSSGLSAVSTWIQSL